MKTKLVFAFFLCSVINLSCSITDPGDFDVLKQFEKGLENPELLQWSENGDDPCLDWKHVFCSGSRVTQIQVQGLGLKGTLPQTLNKLSKLQNLGLQRNLFSGNLPSFSGLSNLQFAYLDYNDFDSIPLDFFDNLSSLEVLALDHNDFNSSSGWSFPLALMDSAQLTNLSCMSCNLVGPLPDFLGKMSSLTNLKLSENSLSGEIPASFNGLDLRTLWLNDQVNGGGLSGSIDVVTTMSSLEVLWLHGNQFTGIVPSSIGNLTLLRDLNLNGNRFVGLVPDGLVNLPLEKLDLNNNQFMGPVPDMKKGLKFTYESNCFCRTEPGVPCSPVVMSLIDFIGDLNYPVKLVSSWSGNDPCGSSWLGLNCDGNGEVDIINLPDFNLTGTLSPSIAKLDSLTQIKLQSNHISGSIPQSWTSLKKLKTLDLTGNNILPPVPDFGKTVRIVLDGNRLLVVDGSGSGSVSPSKENNNNNNNPPTQSSVSSRSAPFSIRGEEQQTNQPTTSTQSRLLAIIVPVTIFVVILMVLISVSICCCVMRKKNSSDQTSVVIQPRDPSVSDNNDIKIVVANNNDVSISTLTETGSHTSKNSSHVFESGNLIISVQVLKNVTNNFAPQNELGRGGFGVVYKGELQGGTQIAVKRMETGVINTKGLNEFEAEIAVLSKVRHRHLVSLLGYSVGGNERMLVYEFMSQGALSRHLFHWKKFELEPLSLKKRIAIALDVARGMEYLHNLAHQTFIHRDLKSSNILLDEEFRAKVSDFGLVKLAPDEKKSVVTRLAGTFGYLAPEYAVTGKVTTKVDVFSFGVVLMELLTGLIALDEDRPEESQYLASYFWHIKSDKEKLKSAIDKSLDINTKSFETICIMAELAGHCTAREPNQRPDMGHAVNILGPLVEKWRPLDDAEIDEYVGIDYSLPLNQMVKGWQEAEGNDSSYVDLDDSKGSIPARPNGFAESFTSADGR